MKCLTLHEFDQWGTTFGFCVEHPRNLQFAKELKQVTCSPPPEPDRLFGFATRLVEWLPQNVERVFYLSDWPLYTPEEMIFFMKIRMASGESRDPMDSPAHWFDGQSVPDRYESDDIPSLTANPVLQECAVMAGLIFLALTFQWQGYIIAKDCSDHIYLGDASITFFQDNAEEAANTRKLLSDFNLKVWGRRPG
jgi:hypothetical protein